MPITLWERLKQFLWHLIEPIFPTIRDACVLLGIVSHEQRQDFVYGFLKEGATLQLLRQHLLANGFSDDYVSWIDPGETLNMRKPHQLIWQYHVRLFEDNEVRAHLEYTPESHPWKHLFEKGMTPGQDYLKSLLAPLLQILSEPIPARPDPK